MVSFNGLELDSTLLSKAVIDEDLVQLQRTLLSNWSYRAFFDTLQANCDKSIDEELKAECPTDEDKKKSEARVQQLVKQKEENEMKRKMAVENEDYLTRKINFYRELRKSALND